MWFKMYFKLFIYYAIVAFEHLQKECKINNTKMTTKKLSETIWLMYYVYDKRKIKEKAENVLNNLELIEL